MGQIPSLEPATWALGALLLFCPALLLCDFFYLGRPGAPRIPAEELAAPLTALGLWILSLFFLRAGRSFRLIQLAVVGYICLHASQAPGGFLEGSLVLLALVAWPVALLVALTDRPHNLGFLALWLPGLGATLYALRRPDFSHLEITLPFLVAILLHTFSRLRARYPLLPRIWLFLPVLLLVLASVAARFLEA